MSDSSPRGVLYLVVCASPRARHIAELVTRAHTAAWEVCVVATPAALSFIDKPALEKQTGHPVRHAYQHSDEPDLLPAPDAIIVCPATFNTINKWAAGISDTFALSLITEAIGMRIPLVAAPALNSAQAAHTAFARSVAALRDMGVTVLYGPGVYEPGPPRTGGRPYPWDLPLQTLEDKLGNET